MLQQQLNSDVKPRQSEEMLANPNKFDTSLLGLVYLFFHLTTSVFNLFLNPGSTPMQASSPALVWDRKSCWQTGMQPAWTGGRVLQAGEGGWGSGGGYCACFL